MSSLLTNFSKQTPETQNGTVMGQPRRIGQYEIDSCFHWCVPEIKEYQRMMIQEKGGL